MPTSEPSAARQAWLRTVPLLMLLVAFGHFNRVAISVVGTEQLIPNEGISAERMGLVYSAFLATYTIAMFPGGWFIDRYGSRTALTAFCFGSATLVMLTGASPVLGHWLTNWLPTGMGTTSVESAAGSILGLWLALLVIRGILGMFNAPMHPGAAHVVYEQIPPRSRGFANGVVTCAACFGIAATYTVMGSLIDRYHWPTAFLITGGATLVVALVWTLGFRPAAFQAQGHAVGGRVTLADLFTVLRRRSVLCLALSYGALGYFQYLFFYWMQYYFETVQKYDRNDARHYTTMIVLAMGVGMFAGGWLTDRAPVGFSRSLRRALVPALGMLGSGLFFELALFSTHPALAIGAFASAAALIGACEGGFWTTSVELGGRSGGAAAGFMNTIGNVGGTISPYLTPRLGAWFALRYGEDLGWQISLAIAGGIVILGALLWAGVSLEDAPVSLGSGLEK